MHTAKTIANQSNDENIVTVLVVDRDVVQLESISRGLFLHGHRCIRFTNAVDAMAFLKNPLRSRVDVLLTDLTEPHGATFQLIVQASNAHPTMPVVALCGWSSNFKIEAAKRRGISTLVRPFSSEQLDRAIRDALSKMEA